MEKQKPYLHGMVYQTFPNGDSLHSEYEYNVKNGVEILIKASGDIFRHYYKNNVLHGYCEHHYMNNTSCKGEFKNGLRHGNWVIFDDNGYIIKIDKWIDNKFLQSIISSREISIYNYTNCLKQVQRQRINNHNFNLITP